MRVAKAPSTPEAPLGALLSVLDKAAVPGAAIERIVHGSTVATNTVLQRRGARSPRWSIRFLAVSEVRRLR